MPFDAESSQRNRGIAVVPIHSAYEAELDRRLRAVVEGVVGQLGSAPRGMKKAVFERFVRRYFADIALEDLEERTADELAGAVRCHVLLAMSRPEGRALVRVMNPDPEQHGWRSGHTVIDVICDDRPYLVDTVSIALARRHIGTFLLVHPIVFVTRSANGALLETENSDGVAESWMHFEVERQFDENVMEALTGELLAAIADATAAADDAGSMKQVATSLAVSLPTARLPVSDGEVSDAVTLLDWLVDGHFQFLGYRKYEMVATDRGPALTAVGGSGLGLLRETARSWHENQLNAMPADMRLRLEKPELMIVTKDVARSTVARNEYFDYLGVKIFGPRGKVVGEHRFLGLFDLHVFRQSVFDIPILRAKAQAVITASGLSVTSHRGRELVDTLEAFPRDDMFHISVTELQRIAVGITNLQERKQVALFARRDGFGRFVSCLVYVPRERFSTTMAEKIAQVVQDAYGGTSTEIDPRVTERILARLHIRVQLRDDAPAQVDESIVEERIADLTRWWIDELRDELVSVFGEAVGAEHYPSALDGFPPEYREAYGADVAVSDLQRILELSEERPLVTAVNQAIDAAPNEWRFKVYAKGAALPLSGMLPLLDNLGLTVIDEHPYVLGFAGGVWLHDIGVTVGPGVDLRDPTTARELQATFGSLWRNELENDGFNRLIVSAGLTSRQVVVLRAYSRYLRQVGNAFTPSYIESTMCAHPSIARLLVALFDAKFDPATGPLDGRKRDTSGLREQLMQALEAVTSLDEDRILRSFASVIAATLRTNAFRPLAAPSAPCSTALSFKLDPEQVPDLPLPRPMFEIWVYSPRVEGIHLRGGRIARGGLRWSDRREDFRTEVLGLMKAQMVKNAVIVPAGAKGGFVVKQLPTDPVARRSEVVACYEDFVGGLLDITDNLVAGVAEPPAGVVRHDGDDTYLVVAADKGTASFSDTANAVARRYGFWLGDAFASGGSVGYDHKEMAITARGAWESVRRHFRILGRNADTETINLVGIGDMSGDVFGNGLLLSKHMKLVAAFDHRHIFLDPDPDIAVSFDERRRLFSLPVSSWDDYDRSLISDGGGVYPRNAKRIQLSKQAAQLLEAPSPTVSPPVLIQLILRARVDLLWNGGIGTYVKATGETHADVGDRSNDALRIDASELRCTVVAEGGNLGLTQRARVEFAMAGGFINTDAIDNSAGVDCSDHEVNIKIALDRVVVGGDLTVKQRNALLASMTSEVAELVLEDNRAQNLALAVARHQGPLMTDVHARQIRTLELRGAINRRVEFLPDEKALAERVLSGRGLTTPEMSVLLAYTKETTTSSILDSKLPDDPFLHGHLRAYFPRQMQKRLPAAIDAHPLRREIVATCVVNKMVNHAGLSFLHRMAEETSATVEEITMAHVVASTVFDLEALWESIDRASVRLPPGYDLELFLAVRRMTERGVLWLLRNRRSPIDMATTVAAFQPGVRTIAQNFADIAGGSFAVFARAAAKRHADAGVPKQLAERAAVWPFLHTALDIVKLAAEHVTDTASVGSLYWSLFDSLSLGWLWEQVGNLPRSDRWQAQARAALRDDLLSGVRDLTGDALSTPGGLAGWSQRNASAIQRALSVLDDVRSQSVYNVSTLTVALRQVRGLKAS